MTDSDRQKIEDIWKVHQSDDWPNSLGGDEGQLMTLDTVIGGCLSYFLDEYQLDAPRVEILRDCLAELDPLFTDLPEEASEYFRRLRYLGVTVLQEYS